MNHFSFVLLIFVIWLSGCATAGTKIDISKLSQIKEGKTTKAEVIQLLGNPEMITLTSDSKQIMMYSYFKVRNRAVNFIPVVDLLAGGMDMDNQTVQILIDENDRVEKYIATDTSAPINSGLLNQNGKIRQ